MKRKEISIYVVTIVLMSAIILIAIAFNGGGENKIKRILKESNIKPGEIISVTLDVSIKEKDTYYAIEEHAPSGWTIIDYGGGATNDPNKLAWVVIQYAEDTKYTYTIKAPNLEGEYITSGNYMFEDFSEPVTIGGDNVVKVSS